MNSNYSNPNASFQTMVWPVSQCTHIFSYCSLQNTIWHFVILKNSQITPRMITPSQLIKPTLKNKSKPARKKVFTMRNFYNSLFVFFLFVYARIIVFRYEFVALIHFISVQCDKTQHVSKMLPNSFGIHTLISCKNADMQNVRSFIGASCTSTL